MRVLILWLVISYFCVYAWKDWYKALCVLLVFMAITERPDIPKSLLGITGLSPWNILFASIFLAWFAARAKVIDNFILPNNIKFYLGFYIFIVIFSFSRLISDYSGLNAFELYQGSHLSSFKGLFIDEVINSLKYFIVALLILSGCNSKKRFILGLGAILVLNFLLAIQVIKWMPLGELANGYALEQRAIRVLDREIGYYRSDLAVILAGASWAIYAARGALTSSLQRGFALFSWLACALAVALTGGRIGLVAWVVTAFVLTIFRWWRFLILVPILLLLVVIYVPSVMERMTQGTGGEGEEADTSAMTSGRSEMWPLVIESIKEEPWLGYGRLGMKNSGISLYLGEEYGMPFPHPHNAYLELLLDNGVILSIPIFLFFLILLGYSLSLFRDSRNQIFIVAGGSCFAYLTAHLVGSIGSQSFYPNEGSISMWCVIALMLRVYYERKNMETYSKLHNIPFDKLEPWGQQSKEVKAHPVFGKKNRVRN